MEEVFTNIYRENGWKDSESVSGRGSTLKNTEVARAALKNIIGMYEIKSMLDIPCGDMNWMKEVMFPDGFKYIGADVVPALIEKNRDKYGLDFRVMDITKDALPDVDLIFVRDLLGHFSNRNVKKALINIQLSGAKYFMATTFPDHHEFGDIKTGQWRPINLQEFFGLPDPIMVINEQYLDHGGKFADKSLGLWKVED